MDELDSTFFNPTRLLFELQNIDQLIQSLSGSLEPAAIATRITDGLVAKFDCCFARIWLVEPDFTQLRLVASSGMYTRLDGDFARVPMGAYKVGKIAQHCIPFLSNSLAQETWVKDRQWAIANNICGFAGLPLAVAGRAIGVLAVFSQQPMQAEFLEALRILCSSVSVALNNAGLYQHEMKRRSPNNNLDSALNKPLSEQISDILADVGLTLVGTEQPLSVSSSYILLKTAETLRANNCSYCRLTYGGDRVRVEAMLALDSNSILTAETTFGDMGFAVTSIGGRLQIDISDNNIVQFRLFIPYSYPPKTESNLSDREQEVIKLLAAGLRDREIAEKLFISDRTVKFHINNIVAKLNARTRIQAMHEAYRRGFFCL